MTQSSTHELYWLTPVPIQCHDSAVPIMHSDSQQYPYSIMTQLYPLCTVTYTSTHTVPWLTAAPFSTVTHSSAHIVSWLYCCYVLCLMLHSCYIKCTIRVWQCFTKWLMLHSCFMKCTVRIWNCFINWLMFNNNLNKGFNLFKENIIIFSILVLHGITSPFTY
jgi:hypothetical protein